ncbi:MAG: carboxypeptidase-like regulatory domain-containing protein [Candidatus ainarchaeum sp.]|nr:carboxypeptidase-like regulatory domain-containing protein [Candidatus ainarchaeum sp.]
MGLRDFYFGLEDKYYKMIDKLDTIFPAHAIVDRIDKVMPSMILFFILFVVIIVLIIWAVIPSYAQINVSFFNDGLSLKEKIPFSMYIGDENYSFVSDGGSAIVKIPKSDLYRIKVDTSKYSIDKDYSFSDEIKVLLDKKKKNIPIQIYFKSGYSDVESASAIFDCDNISIPDSEASKETNNGYIEITVPEDCGILNISASAEGYNSKNDVCDSTSCVINFESATSVSDNGKTNIPTANIVVKIADNLGSKDGQVTIYDSSDLINPVETGYSLNGYYNSKALAVGGYKVAVNVGTYLPQTKTIVLTEAGMNVDFMVMKNTLGNVLLKVDEETEFSYKLKDLNNNILDSGNSDKEVAFLPVFEYGKYLIDLTPDSNEFGVISNEQVEFKEGTSEITLDLKEITSFNAVLVKLHVIDESESPIQGAKAFVQDLFSGFEVFSYNFPETDENGDTQLPITEEGAYSFRVYKGYSEGMSEQVTITFEPGTEMPEEELDVVIYLGNGSFNITVLDELDYVVPFAQIDFYTKGLTKKSGTKLTDNAGKLLFSLKAGTEKFFVASKEGYMPFYSEARFLTPANIWDINANLEPQKLKEDDEKARVEYLGVFDALGGEPTNFEVDKAVYLGYDIHLYTDVDEMNFEYTTGKETTTVEQDSLFIFDSSSSSQVDSMYEDLEKTIYTEDKGKILTAKWTTGLDSAKVEKGIYRIYVKVMVRNDSSVSLYEPLNIKWKLYLDEKLNSSEEKEYFLGSSLDCSDMFCAKTSLLDIENQIYVENIGNVNKNEQKYPLVIGKKYKTEFTLMNGITASDGEIENGYLKAHTATSSDTSFMAVENDVDKYNFYQFSNISLSGPNSESQYYGAAKTILVDKYNFTKFFANKTISGSFNLIPTYDNGNYINFWVIDSDKQVPVRGAPAFNYWFVPDAPHSLSIKLFPNTLLVPNKVQNLKVYVYDELESVVKDAKVVVLKKAPNDSVYKTVQGCNNLTTDYEGKVVCELPPFEPNTFIQVLAYKEGYKSYKHNDLLPDLKVVEEIISFNPAKLDITISYPKEKAVVADLTIANASAQDLIINNIDLQFDKYSENSKFLLNWEAMEAYFESEYKGKVIYGIEEDKGVNETILQNFFKVIANDTFDKSVYADKIGGIIKVTLDTSPGTVTLDIPFSIKFKLDSYPENAGECLKISMLEKDFYIEKATNTEIEMINTCLLDSEKLTPAIFDKLFLLLTLEDGSYSIVNYSLTIPDKVSKNVDIGVPALLLENLKTDVTKPDMTGFLGMTPKSVKGNQKIGIKLMGYVTTESGPAKLESNTISINVNTVELANCIGVYNDNGEKIDRIDFGVFSSIEYLATAESINNKVHGPSTEIEIKNECSGSLLYIRACKDNENNFSPGCGNENSDAKLSFSVEDFTKGIELAGGASQKVEIYRPSIPGAYALDLWVKTKDQWGYKKIYDVKTNVKTTTAFGYFSYNPFLPMFDLNTDITPMTNGDEFESDIMYLFNRDLWVSKMSDLETLEKIAECDTGGSGCWNSLDRLDLSSGLGDDGDSVDNSETARKAVFYSGVGVAGVGVIILIGVALCASSVPVAGWIIGGAAAIAAGTFAIISALAPDDFEQITEYHLFDMVGEDIALDAVIYSQTDKKTYNWLDGTSMDPVKLTSLFGERYYDLYYVNKEVAGSVGFAGGDHKKDLWFTVYCGTEYEPVVDAIVINDIKKEVCGWPEDEPFVVNGSDVEFRPDCSDAGFLDGFELHSHVYVPCVLKPKNWVYEQFKGVDYGLPNTGLARVKYTTKDLKPGYNYFDVDMNVIGLLDIDPKEVKFRVSLYNPLSEEEKILPLGDSCKNLSGEIIGYTGEKARPKLKFVWDWQSQGSVLSPYEDMNFCNTDNYCDSTQFMMNMFNRINTFNDEILDLSKSNDMDLPKTNPQPETLKPEYDYDPAKAESLGVKSVKLEFTNSNLLYLKVSKDVDVNVSKISVIVGGADGSSGDMAVSSQNPNVFTYTISDQPVEEYKDLDGKKYSIILKIYSGNESGLLPVNVTLTYIPEVPAKPINVPLSTEIMDGAMALSKWFWDTNMNLDDATSDTLFDAQKKIYFLANIMKDGFTEDFFNDFVNSCNSEFFVCPSEVKDSFMALMEEGRLKVVNVDGTNKLNGPGKYVVRTIIDYKNTDLEIKDANIIIILEKVEPPIQDNILYYMPLDGPIGISDYSVDRQGYGVDFSGATIDLFKLGNLAKKLTVNTTSNPINTVNVESNYDFASANKIARGRVLGINTLGDQQVFVNFVPMNQTKFNFELTPETDKDTKFCYEVELDDQIMKGPDSLLPFFAKDPEAKDFTGQMMVDNYPKFAEAGVCGDQAGLKYSLESVMSSDPIGLYTYVYALNNTNVKVTNSSYDNTESLSGKTLSSVFDDIAAGRLCINSTSQTMDVFWNEYAQQN